MISHISVGVSVMTVVVIVIVVIIICCHFIAGDLDVLNIHVEMLLIGSYGL